MEILITGMLLLSFTLKQNIFVISLRIFVGYMQMGKVPFSEKETILCVLGDQSHRKAYKFQMLKNDLLLNKL